MYRHVFRLAMRAPDLELPVLLAVVAVGLGYAGCQPRLKHVVQGEAQATLWPQQLGGRALQVVAQDYVLYARDETLGEALRKWIDMELDAFCSRYHCELPGTGIVFAIEPGEEPADAVEEWRGQNVNRARAILWTSPIRKQFFSSEGGRPYSFAHEPYFRESFSIPVKERAANGLLPCATSCPAWICFLTTDEALRIAFDEELREHRTSVRESVANVPLIAQLLSAGGVFLMQAVAETVYARYLPIDRELMHLQRRETLWGSLIGLAFRDASRRRLETSRLQKQIDEEWKYIWVRRPID